MSLLQKAKSLTKVAEKNVRKTNCGHDELVFLARVIKGSRRSRRRLLQMWLGLNRRRALKLGFFYLLLILWYYCLSCSQRNITVPSSAHSCRRFRQDSFNLSFYLKNMTRSTPPNCLLSNPLRSFSNTEDRLQKWFMHFKRVSFSNFWGTRNTNLLIFLPFCSKRSKQVVLRMTKTGNV